MSRKTRAAERKARVEAARVKCEALVNERPDEHKITPEKIAAIPAPWIELKARTGWTAIPTVSMRAANSECVCCLCSTST